MGEIWFENKGTVADTITWSTTELTATQKTDTSTTEFRWARDDDDHYYVCTKFLFAPHPIRAKRKNVNFNEFGEQRRI